MKKKFPEEIRFKIDSAIAKSNNPIAVFDADGTLWDTDIGEAFFKFQIKNSLLRGLPPDPWQYYRTLKAQYDPRPAYLWLAQINKGLQLEEVNSWAKSCVEELSPIPIFSEIEDLFGYLDLKKVQVYIVSASVKWAIEPAAQILGIPKNQVLGVATKVKNGVITAEQDGIITYKEGKAEELLSKTNQLKPILACGNSMGDISLLELSTDVSLAVQSVNAGAELFSTEQQLRSAALTNGWEVYNYVGR